MHCCKCVNDFFLNAAALFFSPAPHVSCDPTSNALVSFQCNDLAGIFVIFLSHVMNMRHLHYLLFCIYFQVAVAQMVIKRH